MAKRKNKAVEQESPELKSKRELARTWKTRLDAASKGFEKWDPRCEKIIKRYRDERDGSGTFADKQRRFNILWSNVQTLTPAYYGRPAKPEVSRRFKDQDPVGRTAALMLERAIEFEVEHYPDFDTAMRYCVEDRLLPGRGVAWIRYEPTIERAEAGPQISEDKAKGVKGKAAETQSAPVERVAYECAPTDYVNWRDFMHSPARTWEEVWWVARKVWLTKEEGVERFGDVFNSVPLSSEEKQKTGSAENPPTDSIEQKAMVWEIWDKSSGFVYWIADGYDVCLDDRKDPLGLELFFPCPRPLYATLTTGSLVPVPDYAEYQDQAEELDTLTQRIYLLTRALKVTGIYNGEYKELQRLLKEGNDNTMIGVSAWAAYAEKGGLKGAVDFLPIDVVIKVVEGLYVAREACKQIIYEITGISDIIRGASNASETATAQNIKANYAGLRLKQSQHDVARFASDLMRLKGQIICKHYAPETILAMSGVENTDDAQYAAEALMLLKSGNMKDFRIEVQADSLAQLDDQQEKADRVEFLQAVGGFLEQGAALGTSPPMVSLLGALLKFGVRGFRVGRDVEGSIERAVAQMEEAAQKMASQPPPPDPKVQAEQIRAQAEGAKAQASLQQTQAETQREAQAGQMEQQRLGLENQLLQTEAQLMPQRIQAEQVKSKAQVMTAYANLEKAKVMARTPPKPNAPSSQRKQ